MSMIDGVDDADIQKFDIDDSIVSDNQVIGSFNLNLATIKLINLNKKYSSLKGTWIDTAMGRLYIYEAPEKQGDITIELKCYDLAYKFDEEYVAPITFPATVGDWLAAICQKVDVELATTEFTNSTTMLGAQPFLPEGASYRDAVREIAGAAGGFAQIIENKLYIKWFENTVTELDDWFSLTQEERVSPVNIVVLGRGDLEDNIMYPSEAPDAPHELRIDDNQILYKMERELIQPIYDQVVGFNYQIFSLRYVGLKNVKAGQKVRYIDIDGETVETYIMTNSLSFCGGDYNNPKAWESTISSVQLNETATNYKYAGTVMKAISNTEAAVDKVNQQISLVVERQTELDGKLNANHTSVTQTIDKVVTSVQNSGGNNLIKNSAMYFLDENRAPSYWEIAGTGTLEITPSAEAGSYGVLSGQVIRLRGETISQKIQVKADDSEVAEADKTYYTFSCRMRKAAVGEVKISLSDSLTERMIDLSNGDEATYKEYSIDAILPVSAELTLTVSASEDADFMIADMMLAVGNYRSQWTQANGELANTEVQIDVKGVEVRSSTVSGSYAQFRPQGISIYKSGKLVSSLNNDEVVAPKAEIREQISMPPLQIRATSDGWAFVPMV